MAEGSGPSLDRRLTSINIKFTDAGRRPKSRLKLKITAGDAVFIREFGKDEPISLDVNFARSTPATARVNLYTKRKRLFTKKLVSVDVPLASVTETPIIDAKSGVEIALAFAPDEVASSNQPGTSEEHEDSHNEVADPQNVGAGVLAAREQAEKKEVIFEKFKGVGRVMKALEAVGEALSDIHPAIGLASSALGKLSEACEKQEGAKNAALGLIDELEIFLSIEKDIPELKQRKETRRAVEHMLRLIAEAAGFITTNTSTGLLSDLLWSNYPGKIRHFKEEFAKARTSFDFSIRVEIFKAVHTMQQDMKFERLKPCNGAYFKSGEGNVCLPETRKALIDKYKRWNPDWPSSPPDNANLLSPVPPSDEDRYKVFWLHGMAGSGKSSAANTVADLVEKAGDKFDLSCFFCKRDDPELSNPLNVLPTLSYSFTQQHGSYRGAVFDLLNTPKGASIHTSDIKKQFDLLFKEPLVKTADPFRPHVVVVDALDECRDPKAVAECILLLAKAAPWIKVFVTSRNETEIRDVFSEDTDCLATNINEEVDVNADIRRFISTRWRQIKHLQLSDEEVDRLVTQAAGLFIWCSTLFKYLEGKFDPKQRLMPILTGHAPGNALDQLFGLYESILKSAVSDEQDTVFMRTLLGIIYVSAANRPLPEKSLAEFMQAGPNANGVTCGAVQSCINALHAVLYKDSQMQGAIRVLHPSFLDFLRQKVKSGVNWRRPENLHELMFRGCIAALKGLRFNICGLHDASVLNRNLPDLRTRISQSISLALQYGSLFWFTHLSNAKLTPTGDVQIAVSDLMCTKKALFWLEVMSLLDTVGQSIAIAETVFQYFRDSPDIAEASYDIYKFVLSSPEAMSSTPHLYISALAWAPEESWISKHLAKLFKHLPLISRNDIHWDATVWTRGVGAKVYCVAYSPDDRLIASASADWIIRIWNARTGILLRELQGHTDEVNSVAFSTNSQTLASGSDDKTVCIWNAQTGVRIGEPLTGHTARVWAVTFSPDGSLIASGSGDSAVCVWDVQAAALFCEPLNGHSGGIRSLAFSPKGQHIASGSEDHTIRIWDFRSGGASKLLEGHSGAVRSVAFSADGKFLTSGSGDRTVRIWDAKTAGTVGKPLVGHVGEVNSVSFTQDGRYIVSGSDDKSVRIWSVQTGASIGEPLEGHSGWVWSVAISSSGEHIASGSDDGTVRVWDRRAGARAERGSSQGHSGWVFSVAFSADGQCIASGSDDKTVCVWNAQTGALVGKPFEGHTGEVLSVAFSADCRYIASGSRDYTVRVWDVQAGAAECKLLEGHTDVVRSVAFLLDGRYLASGSDDETVRMWDFTTGAAIGDPLKGHSGPVNSVTFSPDSRYVISGSSDKAVRMWDVETHALVGHPLEGHTDTVWSVACSRDGRYIASGSADDTIRLWDLKTGAMVGNPFKGHSSSVYSVAFSPDGRFIASGSGDRTMRLWDVQTGVQAGEPLRGHTDTVFSVAFSPDGRSIASGSWDSPVRVWDAGIDLPDAGQDPEIDDAEPTSGDDETAVQGETKRAAALGAPFKKHAIWEEHCSQMMENTDGWVRDGEKLLLWVPYRFRKHLGKRRLLLAIDKEMQTPGGPRVDIEKLFEYAGTRWANIYPNETARASSSLSLS